MKHAKEHADDVLDYSRPTKRLRKWKRVLPFVLTWMGVGGVVVSYGIGMVVAAAGAPRAAAGCALLSCGIFLIFGIFAGAYGIRWRTFGYWGIVFGLLANIGLLCLFLGMIAYVLVAKGR